MRSLATTRSVASNRTLRRSQLVVTGLAGVVRGSPVLRVEWTWATGRPATNYRVERRVNGGDWVFVDDQETPDYNDTDVVVGNTYELRVTASLGTTSGPTSAPFLVEVTPEAAPDAPTLALTDTATNSITLTFTLAGTGGSVVGIDVYRRLDGIGSYELVGLVNPLASLVFVDSPLPSDTDYQYKGVASGPGGVSADSNVVSASTDVGLVVPETPTNFDVIPGSVSASASWTDNADNEEGYWMELAPDVAGSPGTWSIVDDLVGHHLTYNYTGLTPGTVYHAATTAYNAAGPSSRSNVKMFTTSVEALPGVLLDAASLSELRAKASSDTVQWQGIQAACDSLLPVYTLHGYQTSYWGVLSTLAAAYQGLLPVDPVTAKRYADKALGVIKHGIRAYMKTDNANWLFLARGDGVTTTFDLPYTDNINLATFKVALSPIVHATVASHNLNSRDTIQAYNYVIKVTTTADGPAAYTKRVMTARYPETWSAGDWRQNPTYSNGTLDWSGAVSQPASGASYFYTRATTLGLNALSGSAYSVVGGQLIFNTPPASTVAVFIQYQYGTFTEGVSTLGYQQTSDDIGGYNSVFVDNNYTARYFGHAALAYDWLYDYVGFSPSFRAEVAAMLVRWFDYLIAAGYQRTSMTANHGAGSYWSMVLIALALNHRGHADGSRLLTTILSHRNTYMPRLTDPAPFVPGGAGNNGTYYGGIWGEGWSYGQDAAAKLVETGIALKRAGIDTSPPEFEWANDLIRANLATHHSMAAVGEQLGYQESIGDSYAWPWPSTDTYNLAVLAYAATDTQVKAWANYWIQHPNASVGSNWQDILYRDPDEVATDWRAEGEAPIHHYSQGYGWIYRRADWTYASKWSSFFCSNLVSANHVSRQPGTIRLMRGMDDLVVDAARIALDISAYNKTVYGNMTQGNGLNYVTAWGMGGWYGDPGCTMSKVHATVDYATAYGVNMPGWTHNQNLPGTGGPFSESDRTWMDLDDDLVIVHDRATLKLNTYFVRHSLHHAFNPSIVGNSWSGTLGSSKLFGTTLSDAALTTNAVGPLSIAGATSWNRLGTVYQIWRLESVPAPGTTRIRFCTVLQVAPSGTLSGYPVTRIVSDGGEFDGCVINGNRVVMFGDDPGPIDTTGGISYSYTGSNGANVNHYIHDLTPSQLYTLSGAGSGTATANAVGILEFTIVGTGAEQTVTIT